jgi:hypothetical protein
MVHDASPSATKNPKNRSLRFARERIREPFVARSMGRMFTRISALVGTCVLACCSSPGAMSDDTEHVAGELAPTYSQLYEDYFALGTPGHCATAGCHADPGHTVWACGATKAECYAGMTRVGLIDPIDPTRSPIASPTLSPLVWINPSGGNMPFDTPAENAAARQAIAAWVAAGARDD